MKSPDVRFFCSVLIVLSCMTYASIEKDVIFRSLAVSVAVFSIAVAFKWLASIGIGSDHE